ncbi:Major facilitator transporter [Vibrio owensii]|uniref:Major facilitator transporter n=1 Tax=Vibrio owensii TaxID=696485 RepID=A0AAU9Q8N4_9VIBR|nr:Major facilitator transporter [Vibrio owensii]
MTDFRVMVFACLFLSIIQISMGLVFPALPTIAEDFDISLDNAQLLITAYLFGFGPSQFVYGPLSDALGRKNVVVAGLLISIFGLWLIIFKNEVLWWTLTGRFLQGLGMGCCLVLAAAIVRDRFRDYQLPAVFSQITIVISIVPMIAPLLGGMINEYIGWLGIFLVLVVYVIMVCVAVACCFQETMPRLRRIPKLKQVFKQYGLMLTSRYFMSFALLGWLNFSLLITMISVLSFIMQNQIGMTSDEYAIWALIPAFGPFIGAYISRRTLPVIGNKRLLSIAYCCHISSAIWLFCCPVGPFFLMFGLFLMVLGNGISGPCIQALVIKPYKKDAGAASAMVGGGEMIMAALFSQLLVFFGVNEVWHLSWVIGGCALIAFVVLSRPPWQL